MTKNDMIHQLVKRTNLTTSQATHAVEGVIAIIADAIVKNDPVRLRGFGAIKTARRAAKTARDINRGKTITIPARRQVKFIAYAQLQARLDHEHKDIIR